MWGWPPPSATPSVYQSYNIWRNNTSYNNHTNFSLQDGVVRCLFENNTGYYMGLVWTGGNGWCLQFTGTDCIFRFNTLYDDTGTVYTARQWPGTVGTMTGSANGSTPSLVANKVYNNTVYGETDQTGVDQRRLALGELPLRGSPRTTTASPTTLWPRRGQPDQRHRHLQ